MRLGEGVSYSGSLDPTGLPRDGDVTGVSLVNIGNWSIEGITGYQIWAFFTYVLTQKRDYHPI